MARHQSSSDEQPSRLMRWWTQVRATRWFSTMYKCGMRIWRAPLGALVTAMALVMFVVIAIGANRQSVGRDTGPAVTVSPSASPTPSTMQSPTPLPTEPLSATSLQALQTQLDSIESRYDVQIGLAVAGIAPVGSRLTATWSAGSISTAPAWGTIDLPIAVAIANLDTAPSNLSYMLTKSISESSLSSDEALYTFLGSTDEAAETTTQILRDYGDQETTVPTTTSRQGIPAFSQADWAAGSQAEFLGQLWCTSSASYAVSFMRFTDDTHNYGFAKVIDSYTKVSEATTESEEPILRQAAIIPTSHGDRVGVSLIVIGQRDQLIQAREAADAVAGQVYFTAAGFGDGRC